MMIGIEGGLGSGKTVLMVRYLLKDFLRGKSIMANCKLFGVDYEILDVSTLLQKEGDEEALKNISLGIDEITVFADCRTSAAKGNRIMSYFALQSRKRSVDVYYTTQDFRMVDYRLIRHTDIQIIAEKIMDNDGDEIPDVRRYALFDMRDRRNIQIKRFTLDISKFYEFYDTDEIIQPPIIKR